MKIFQQLFSATRLWEPLASLKVNFKFYQKCDAEFHSVNDQHFRWLFLSYNRRSKGKVRGGEHKNLQVDFHSNAVLSDRTKGALSHEINLRSARRKGTNPQLYSILVSFLVKQLPTGMTSNSRSKHEILVKFGFFFHKIPWQYPNKEEAVKENLNFKTNSWQMRYHIRMSHLLHIIGNPWISPNICYHWYWSSCIRNYRLFIWSNFFKKKHQMNVNEFLFEGCWFAHNGPRMRRNAPRIWSGRQNGSYEEGLW